MSLKFIYGRAGSGKSRYCLESIKKRIESGTQRPIYLIVPEQMSFQTEKNFIQVVGTSGIFKAEVLSFKRMAYKILSEVGGITKDHMNASGANMLLYKIMEENKKDLTIFQKSADKIGFINTISNMITEFKRYNITPEIIMQSKDNIKDESLKYKIEDITLIYKEFQAKLHKNYIDAEDELTIIYDKLDLYEKFYDAEFWFDEFYSFTPNEYKIIEKLIRNSKGVNITLCMNDDKLSPVETTHDTLINIARDNNISIDEPVTLQCNPCRRFINSKELSHLEQNLFSYPYKTYEGETSEICLYTSINKYTEVEETARDIVKACRENGIRYKDIAVITGDLEGYEKIVSAVFDEYEIPYFIDGKREINANPLIVLIVTAVEILSKNWSYDSVFRYLKCGIIDIEKEDVDKLENYVLANGIRGNRWTQDEDWDWKLSYSVKDDEEQKLHEQKLQNINTSRKKINTPLICLDSKFKKSTNAKEMCIALYEYLCEISAKEKIEKWINDFKIDEKVEKANEYNQIWNIVIDVLEQIVQVMGDEKISSAQFSDILKIGFSQYKIGLIPPTLDQVLVGDIKRVRSHDISVTYIIGTNDGIFPSSIKEDDIFTDRERDSLKENGITIGGTSKTKAFEQQFLIYSTLTTCSKYLRISLPICDDAGKAMRPSMIVSRLRKIFPSIHEESNIIRKNDIESDIRLVSGKKATFNQLISNLRMSALKTDVSLVWIEVYKEYMDDIKWKEKLTTVLNGFYYSNDAEIIDNSKIRKLYGNHLTLSVSRLEKFVECPFEYFISYGLRAKERKIYKLTPPDMGSFLHEVIHDFSDKLTRENISWNSLDKDWSIKAVDEIINEKTKDDKSMILNSNFRYKYITSKMKKTILRMIEIISEQVKRGKFIPKDYEVSFNINGDYPPISVNMHSGESVDLVGIIDRIDMFKGENGSYLRIIDYKSGSKDLKLSDVYYGLNLQLLVYLDAILTNMSKKIEENILPGGVFYLKMDDPLIKSDGDMEDIKIEEAIMKSLKLRGLIIADTDIIKKMDENIGSNSLIVPAGINKDGSLSKNSSAITYEQFEILRKYVKDTVAKICEEILEGNISIEPCKNNRRTPCEYCVFKEVCAFDVNLKENCFRVLNPLSDDKIWDILENKYEKNNTSNIDEKREG